MMYNKPLKRIKNIKYKLEDFDNFSTIPNGEEDSPIMKINFNNKDNQLTKSYGESDFQCCKGEVAEETIYPNIANISGIREAKYFDRFSSRQNIVSAKQIYVLTYNNKLYFANLDSGTTIYQEVGEIDDYEKIELFTYYNDSTNHLIISLWNNNLYSIYICDGYSAGMQKIETPYYVYDMCQHNKILFVALEDANNVTKVHFGYDLDPDHLSYSISEMNVLDVPAEYGRVLKLVSLDDLYIVCEYGICKVVSYANQKNHYIENIYLGVNKISKKSIIVCGDEICFMDNNGIKVFDGNNVKKISIYNLDNLYSNNVACFNDGKYYCATRLDYNDGIVDDYGRDNNALIVYDVFNGDINICCDMSIYDMFVYKDKFTNHIAIVTKYNDVFKLKTLSDSGLYNSNKVSKKVWISRKYKNKQNEIKLIKSIYIETKEDVELTICVDGKNNTYLIKGNDSRQKIVINKKVQTFNIKLVSTTANPSIKNLKILVGFYE